MPPDLNTVPLSSGLTDSSIVTSASRAISPPTSRRPSMAPPPIPQTGSVPCSPQPLSAVLADNTGVGMGPGPIRHPRPLTAAELHLELEKEQEGIVNRLTRELSQLRAQTASVASTTSTSSELFTSEPSTSHGYPAFNSTTGNVVVPTSARRHRSSSNLSTRSARSIRDAAQNATSVSGVAAPREHSVQNSNRPSMEMNVRPDISRQNSVSAPAHRVSSVPQSPYISYSQRYASSTAAAGQASQSAADASSNAIPSQPRSPSVNATVTAARYEEAAFHRAELEAVKKENEMLKQRIRELERRVSGLSNDMERNDGD